MAYKLTPMKQFTVESLTDELCGEIERIAIAENKQALAKTVNDMYVRPYIKLIVEAALLKVNK